MENKILKFLRRDSSAEEFIKQDNSKNEVRGYALGLTDQTVFPDFDFNACIAMVNDDPVARGAVKHFVDKLIEGDFDILDRKTTKLNKDAYMELQEKYMFRTKILRKIALVGKLFNNVFVELVRGLNNEVIDMNILDSTTIKPVTHPNGDPIKYISTLNNQGTKRIPEWDAKDIIWIKFDDVNGGYAPVDMRALWENLLAKSYTKQFVSWLFQTGQYRMVHNFPDGITESAFKDFKAQLRKVETDFKFPLGVSGAYESKAARDIKELEVIDMLNKYYDSQTLILLRVAPIDAGITDASGRSSSEAQGNAGDVNVIGFKKIVEDYINYDMFPKMGKQSLLLRFAPNNKQNLTVVLENIQIMKSTGFTNEACKEYLQDKGMYFLSEKIFEDVPDPMEMAAKANTGNPRDKDSAPSRQGKGTGQKNKSIGTGSKGTTRADQK